MNADRRPEDTDPTRAEDRSASAPARGVSDQSDTTAAGSLDRSNELSAGPDADGEEGSPSRTPSFVSLPQQIGRYRIQRLLGTGGFGLVYLGYDEELQRHVAVKVPKPRLVPSDKVTQLYQAEARNVASLDHRHIVPVHDVGHATEIGLYIVSKFIDGTDLASLMKKTRLTYGDAATIVAAVADALHCAHLRGLTHRDIKPGNILLDQQGCPYVTDFGLALRDEDVGSSPGYCGTPAYMSPEQARGEGHRVDGRSDIFSLGIVLYELLTGRRPFRGETRAELMEQILWQEPKPPRQIDDSIPKELERVCLRALAKRAADRYTTAKDFGDDLRLFLSENPQLASALASTQRFTPVSPREATPAAVRTTPPATPNAHTPPLQVVPKGLRPFDEQDADLFLELLPGPRDRNGLPDVIRFWKAQVEQFDPDKTFSVGLIYGPSGCGKSSLVKAGLLPRLSDTIACAYVEATAQQTESRLLRALRRICPGLPDTRGLAESMAALRRAEARRSGRKVLIVLDQFEQWLHVHNNHEQAELVQALRQCDGANVQCLILVRDDFWMAVTRFLRQLEVSLFEGYNCAAVDLFPMQHAKKVLAAFGRASGALPEASRQWTDEHDRFLEQAVTGLADERKVICVRLALFVEMMKGKTWTLGLLKELGGMEGVGVRFLEETFSSATVPPQHRYHEKGARRVLKSLLPESGEDIKGQMRSYHQLLEISGYAARPEEFDELIRILDAGLRLITPTEPAGLPDGDLGHGGSAKVSTSSRFYQLTHDYMVPSLREWLTRRQRETRRGRAELRLAERAALWNAQPKRRFLPTWWEWVGIRWLTDRKRWTDTERQMMQRADRSYGLRFAALLLVLLALALSGIHIRGRVIEAGQRQRAAGLVTALLTAEIRQVPEILERLNTCWPWARPMLVHEAARYSSASRQRLHLSLALLRDDQTQLDYLTHRLLTAAPAEVDTMRRTLASYKETIASDLWRVVEDDTPNSKHALLPVASTLALYDPDNGRWRTVAQRVARALVSDDPLRADAWRQLLEPVGKSLITPLGKIFRDPKFTQTQRDLASSILSQYVNDDAESLVALVRDAEPSQFVVLLDDLERLKSKAIPILLQQLAQQYDRTTTGEEQERLAQQQARVAAALLRFGPSDTAWSLLKWTPDPRARSYLVHWLAPLGIDPRTIIQALDTQSDVSIRRALVLALGQFQKTQVDHVDRAALVELLGNIYRSDPDAGLHAAAEWLLRQWDETDRLTQLDDELRTRDIHFPPNTNLAPDGRQWYVNSQGQTMVILQADDFEMGSPESEEGRDPEDETLHRKRIGRRFAIASKEVTKAQFERFHRPDYENDPLYRDFGDYVKTPDSPMIKVTWYQAAAYCNWLSEQDGIPAGQWCYEANADGQYQEGMRPKPNYPQLTGYRLPTEAEWEYACRAGAKTSRFYGETVTLLPQYAWFAANAQSRSWPVGRLKPNDFGLFDMLGNVWEWCHGSHHPVHASGGEAMTEVVDAAPIVNAEKRVVRGGAFATLPSRLRSASNNTDEPNVQSRYNGFRPARTLHNAATGGP